MAFVIGMQWRLKGPELGTRDLFLAARQRQVTKCQSVRASATCANATMCQGFRDKCQRDNVSGLPRQVTKRQCVRASATCANATMCQGFRDKWQRDKVSGLPRHVTTLQCVRASTTCANTTNFRPWDPRQRVYMFSDNVTSGNHFVSMQTKK